MIEVVTWENRAGYAHALDEMYCLRARIFSDKLGWDVQVEDGREIDVFDSLPGTAYLLYRAEDGSLKGCARLLTTTGPNMLRDVFPVLLDGAPPPRAPRMWESTRFAVEDDDVSNAGLSRGTRELLIGMTEVAQAYGLERVISVCDIRVERVLKQAGLRTDRIGKPVRIGNVVAVAGSYVPDDATLGLLRDRAGIHDSVLGDAPWFDTRKAA